MGNIISMTIIACSIRVAGSSPGDCLTQIYIWYLMIPAIAVGAGIVADDAIQRYER